MAPLEWSRPPFFPPNIQQGQVKVVRWMVKLREKKINFWSRLGIGSILQKIKIKSDMVRLG